MDRFLKILRELAKKPKYQLLFGGERNNFKLFRNDTDFSDIQIAFIQFLNLYSNLLFDYQLGEIDERVFRDFVYEDSYLYWKRTKKDESVITTTDKIKAKNKEETITTRKWLFKRPPEA